MSIRDIVTRQFRLFAGLRDMAEDNRILESVYARCAVELMLTLDARLPLPARRTLHRKVADIVVECPVGSERSRRLLMACLDELAYASPAVNKAVEKEIRSFIRRQFAYAADGALKSLEETTHA